MWAEGQSGSLDEDLTGNRNTTCVLPAHRLNFYRLSQPIVYESLIKTVWRNVNLLRHVKLRPSLTLWRLSLSLSLPLSPSLSLPLSPSISLSHFLSLPPSLSLYLSLSISLSPSLSLPLSPSTSLSHFLSLHLSHSLSLPLLLSLTSSLSLSLSPSLSLSLSLSAIFFQFFRKRKEYWNTFLL